MNGSFALLVVSFALVACGPWGPVCAQPPGAGASAAAHTPPPGSGERKAILDALRVPVERTYHERIVFVVERLKVGAGYAYADVGAQGPDGKPPQELAGMAGDVSALLRKQGGRWKVLKWGSYGGMDLIFECRKKYPKAPRALYPGPND